MFDPLTAASIGLNIAGTFLGADAAKDAAEAKAEQYAVQAAIARKNAAILRKNAIWTLDAGDYNAMRSGMSTGFTIATQRAAQAASGFAVDQGSAGDVNDATRKIGQMDQLTIRTEAARKSFGQREQARISEMEANAYDKAAANARKAGDVSMFSTLLGGASSVADKWLKASDAYGSASGGITTYGPNMEVTGFVPT